MPRIRSIKPEFFRSRTLAECSPRARLTFIGLWTLADDEGRYQYEPELLKADLWPWEPDVDPKGTDACVLELESRGRVCLYQHDGKTYLHIVSWHEHQKINRPSASRLPACHRETHGGPPEPARGFTEESGELSEDSVSAQGALNADLGSRKGIRDLGKINTVVEQARPIDDISAVFVAWQEATRKHRAQLDGKRRRRIREALKSYPLQDVLDAVRGWQHSPHHTGQNPTGTVYNDLDLLLRDAEHLEKFRDLWRDGPPQVMGKQMTEMARIHQDMTRRRPAKEVANGDLGRMDRDRAVAQRQLSRPEG